MKNNFIFFSLLLFSAIFSAQIVNIPDPIFKNSLLKYHNIDTNKDNEIQVSEAENYTGGILITSLGIKNTTGLEAFKNITSLTCQVNLITSLDLSQNKKLNFISCYNNKLTALILPQSMSLTSVEAQTNFLPTLDISVAPNLQRLNVDSNLLTTLDISQNTFLKKLSCNFNQLTTLNSSTNNALEMLECGSNKLTDLQMTSFPALQFLNCSSNKIASLNLATNTNLYSLLCVDNQLTHLDVANNILLEYLDFRTNFIEAISVAHLSFLETLAGSQNKIKILDVSQNAKLAVLDCANNNLTKLNIKNTNNHNVTFYDSRNNPDLNCIMVDHAEYSIGSWLNKDNFANFNEDCSYMNVSELNESYLQIFPNPVKQNFTVRINEKIKEIEIYGQNGQLLKKGNSNVVDVSTLAKGIYIVKVKTDKKTYTKSIIKE